MYRNLKAEMARDGITSGKIAHAIGRCEKTFWNKLTGRAEFTITESLAIRDKFFPDCTLEYLFAQSE